MNVWWLLLAVCGQAWFLLSMRAGRRPSPWVAAAVAALWAVYGWVYAGRFAGAVCTAMAVWLGVFAWRSTRRSTL